MTTVDFIVPGQPQGKGRARIVKIGGFSRMATPEKTVAYEGLIAHVAHQAMNGKPPIEGPVFVTLQIRCQVPASWSQKKRLAAERGEVMHTTKPDADNVIKAVFDGCNGVVWRDDSQVVGMTVTKKYGPSPCVRFVAVELQPVSAGQPQRELLGVSHA